MKRTGTTATALAAAGIGLLLPTSRAPAVPMFVQSQDTPHCDVLQNLTFVHELGLAVGGFPPNELIEASTQLTNVTACPSHDNPNQPNALVRMRNLTNIFWTDVHYVGDLLMPGSIGTTISNEDGLVNGGQAFRIDRLGINRPLLAESININGIFEPGEFWTFVIDDYFNTGALAASAFSSIGVGAGSFGGPSSGSIIAREVPEPSALMALLPTGLLALRRRSIA